MPFSTILWGEEAAKDGLTGTAALTGQNHGATADKLKLKSEPSPPWLQGLGSLSDTKPQGCALVPDEQNAQLPIYGPGGVLFSSDGWDMSLRAMPQELIKGDSLTGQCSSTNVNEGSIVAADIVYGSPIPPWDMAQYRGRYDKVFTDLITITSAAAVTFNSGGLILSSTAGGYSKWANPDRNFEILGTVGQIGAATFGGIMNITNLGGDWEGKQPGLIVNPLSAVTFNPGGFVPALEPIPFHGDSLPHTGMTSTSAGAITVGMRIGRLA